MNRFLLVLLILCTVCSVACSAELKLTSFDIQHEKGNPNLITNGSFEVLGSTGIPTGCKWDSRRMDATCKVDTGSALGGHKCLKITSNMPIESGVYAELTLDRIALEPGGTYTISAWTKSITPGYIRIGGSSDWRSFITLPATNGKWRRVTATFNAGGDDRNFEISVLVKGKTPGVWLDDLKLEAGPRATFGDRPDNSNNSIFLCNDKQDLESTKEGEFKVPFSLYTPRAVSGILVANMSGSSMPIKQAISLEAGASQITVNGISNSSDNALKVVSVRFVENGKEVADAQANMKFYSEAYAKNRLNELKRKLPEYKAEIDKLKFRKQDTSYPMVSYTVLDNFIGYANEDVNNGELKSGIMQLNDLEWINRRLEKELSDALSGKTILAAVPRWTGDTRPVVKSSSFIAPTTIPGKPGIEVRPVFFNGYGHFGQVQDDMEKWPNYGTNIIQMETGPSAVFPEEGKVNKAVSKGILNLLDRAEKSKVAVCLLLSPHYFPEWMFNKYPELRKRREYFIPFCVHAPESQEFLKRYVAAVVAPIKDHPALQSICISNEPRNVEEPCKYADVDFREWLKNRHGDIATLNNRWGTNYKSFDEINVPNPFEHGYDKPMCEWADFVRWNQDFFTSWHKMLADAVHAVAPNLPVHAKVQSMTLANTDDLKCGNDAYLYGTISDINGNDSCNMYTGGKDDFAQSWLENDIYYDLQRSVKDAPVFNSEDHIISDRYFDYVPAEHVRTALWQEAIHGQSATTIWVWERTKDKKSDFAGSIMNRPACARAVGIVNYDLNRAAKEVTAVQQSPAQVLILHDTNGLAYDRKSYERCLYRLYMALNLSGVKVGFVTERQLENGIIPSVSPLFIPNAKHLSNAAFSALKKYKGRLVMVGSDLLGYDEFDKQRKEKLTGEYVPFNEDNTTTRVLWNAVKPKLAALNVRPRIAIQDSEGQPVWGVESREANTANGTIINICNYLNTPVSIKLIRNGKGTMAIDVLTGEKVSGLIKLLPLDVRLLKVKN